MKDAMKKLLPILALVGSAHAQTVAPLPVVNPPAVAIILPVMAIIVVGAAVSGNLEALCTAMKGHYAPKNVPLDQCPDGQWLALAGLFPPR